MNFSAWSIRNPLAPLLAFFILMVLGWQSFNALPITRFPNIDVPVIAVAVSARRRWRRLARPPQGGEEELLQHGRSRPTRLCACACRSFASESNSSKRRRTCCRQTSGNRWPGPWLG